MPIDKLVWIHNSLGDLEQSLARKGLPEGVPADRVPAIGEVQALIEKLVEEEKKRQRFIKGTTSV